MDWKLDRQRREKKQALARKEASRNADIMGELGRDFTQIFGDGKEVSLSATLSKNKKSDNSARSTRPVEPTKGPVGLSSE